MTKKATIVIGVNEGYHHNNENLDNREKLVASIWQEKARKIFEETGIYISCVVSASKTVYNTEWGCPVGGEDTVTITTTANPEFVKDMESWEKAVIEVTKLMKQELKQSTVTIEFETVELLYLK